MSWTTLHLRVTTPLFNGGADSAGETDIRVSSLRGALRFWFRALAGVGIGRRVQDLLTLEKRVFGSTEAASPVKLRVPRQPAPTPIGALDWYGSDGDGQWYAYLLGQGLSKLVRRENQNRGRGAGPPYLCHTTRPYVAPGQEFDLQCRFTDPDAATLVLASLWLLCTYGGLGARVRRGLGGLRITGVDGPLPGLWTADSLATPGLPYYEQQHSNPQRPELWVPAALGPSMKVLAGLAAQQGLAFDLRAVAAEGPPAYPMLSRSHAIAGISGGNTFAGWPEVFAQAAEELRHLRATADYPQARYRPRIKTPEWEQTVHGPGRHFGVGALGLPLNYKDSYSVQADKGPRKDDRLRRASPLWLRAVGEGERWRLLSLAFHGDFLPDDVGVHLWKADRRLKEVTVIDQDVIDRTTSWIDTMREGGTFVRT